MPKQGVGQGRGGQRRYSSVKNGQSNDSKKPQKQQQPKYSPNNKHQQALSSLTTKSATPATPKAAMYITIGPQCSGKTTYLSQQLSGCTGQNQSQGLLDISMDGMPGTYERVGLSVLQNYQETGELSGQLLKRVHKRYLYEYIDDLQGGEQLALVLFFTGDLDLSELRQHLSSCPDMDPAHAALIGDTAEQVYAEGTRATSPTAALFVQAAMGFAVKQAKQDLTAAAHSHPGPVGWGNTNLSAREYKAALSAAHAAGRPVRFVLWGDALPVLSLEELFRRNLLRALRTGKYIPLRVVADYLSRASALLDRLNINTPGEQDRAAELAVLAGFSMDAAGFVTPLPRGEKKKGGK
jgi:hypothetical protein